MQGQVIQLIYAFMIFKKHLIQCNILRYLVMHLTVGLWEKHGVYYDLGTPLLSAW